MKFSQWMVRSYVLTACGFHLAALGADAPRSLTAKPITEPAGLAVYQPAEKVDVLVKGTEGIPRDDDALVWSLCNYRNEKCDQGELPFDSQAWTNGITLHLDGGQYPAGFYYLRLKMKSDGATVSWDGTRPAGFVALGWLPNITPLPLKSADESRFGAQGTNPIRSRDPFNPLYTTLGLQWVYRSARLGSITEEKPFVEKSDEDLKRFASAPESRNRLAYIYDAHGVPASLQKLPSYINPAQVAKEPTQLGQAYGLKDPQAYEALFEKVVNQGRRCRELAGPQLSRNYYQIHWEPDWHYRGSDEDFIAQYAAAREALNRKDPTAILLGGNYGCIDVGNAHLERLFKKGLGKQIDGVVTHLYNTSQGGTGLPQAGVGSPESAQIDRHCRKLRELVDTYIRPGAPIFQTEWGQLYRGSSRMAENPDNLREHLGWFLRGHLIALGEGLDCTWFFYTADHGGMTEATRDKGRNGYGFFFNQDPERHPFGAKVVSPKPIAMGIAAAIRLLEGTKSLGRLDYFGPDVYAYSFRRGDQLLLMMWAPNKPLTVTLDTDASTVTCYDVMGNAKRQNAVDGKVTLALDEQPTYILGVGPIAVANVSGESPLAGLAGEAIQGSLKRIPETKLTMERAGKAWDIDDSQVLPRDLAVGIYRLVERDAKGLIVSSRLLEVTPTTRIEKIVGGSNGFGIHYVNTGAQPKKYDFVCYYDRNEMYRESVEIPAQHAGVLDVPYERFKYNLVGGAKLACFSLYDDTGLQDSKAERWAGVPISKLKDFTPYFGKDSISTKRTPWKNEEDFSVSFRVTDNHDVLKIDIKVKDDVVFTQQHPQYLWRTDCAMIAVGSDPLGGNAWGTLRMFYIHMKADGLAVTGQMAGSPAQELEETEAFKGTVSRDEKAGITTYCFEVPFPSIGDPATIRTERRVGLGIGVIDVDTEEEMRDDKHRDMELLSGVPFYLKSNRTGTLYLESEK